MMPWDDQNRRIRRGDVFLVDFNPARGAEIAKIRPALVIQNDIGNLYNSTVIVAAISSGATARFRVNVEVKAPEGGLKNNSLIYLHQILTVDKSRLGRYLGRLSTETMQKVDDAIRISLDVH